jgi:hypothetical protein
MPTESVVGVTSRDYTHVSKNVTLVNSFFGALLRALSKERHFALVDSLPCQPNHGSQCNLLGHGIGPTQTSLRSITSIAILVRTPFIAQVSDQEA